MEVLDTNLSGVKLIHMDQKIDQRGYTDTTLDNDAMREHGIKFQCVQQRIYHAPRQNTFYGIHFQDRSHPQGKLIYCLSGRGIDYIVDLKKDSPTYKKWIAIEICAEDDLHIYIPQGYGHAFFTLEDNTRQLFSIDEYFYKDSSRQIRYDDKQIGLTLPRAIEVLSDYDQEAPYLAEIEYEV